MTQLRPKSVVSWMLAGFVAAICFVLLASQFAWSGIWSSTLILIDLPLVLVLGTIILVNWLIRSLRWQVCLESVSAPLGLARAYRAIALSQGIASLTPGQTGEAIKLWISRSGSQEDIPERAGIFVAERLVDLAVVLGLAGTGVALSPLVEMDLVGVSIIIASLVGIVVLAWCCRRPIARMSPAAAASISALAESVRNPGRLIKLLSLTLLSWLCAIALLTAVLAWSGIDLPVASLIAVVGLSALAGIASMVPGGVGATELSLIVLLTSLGVDEASAISAALLARFGALLGIALSGMHWAGFTLLDVRSDCDTS